MFLQVKVVAVARPPLDTVLYRICLPFRFVFHFIGNPDYLLPINWKRNLARRSLVYNNLIEFYWTIQATINHHRAVSCHC